MKRWLIIISLMSLLSNVRGQEVVMNFHYCQMPFKIFAEKITGQAGIRIFYDAESVGKLIVSIDSDSITIMHALEMILEGSGLIASWWHNDIVILRGKKLITSLPDYQEAGKETDQASAEKVRSITEAESRYLTGRKPGATRTVKVGRAGAISGKSRATILGRILDIETGEPLISVPVYISETQTGALTDTRGFFTLSLYPGKYNVKIDYLGYEKDQFLMEVLSDGDLAVNLKKTAIELSEVVVSGERQANIRLKDPGLDQIPVKIVRILPMMMGEHDILKVSITLPGIISTGEGGAGLNVRGSGADQNAFYINRIPVYNTSHLFGFFSAFNSDIVKDFSIYKGHIPAEFGGKLASVFNITTRQGNRKRFTLHGGLSPVAGNLVLEGPLKKDTASILFSMRSSYSDWILSRIRDTTINASAAGFNDLSGGINWDIRKTQVSIFGYHSKDRFRLAEINDYGYSNEGASIIVSNNFTNSLRGEFSIIGSQYSFSTTDKLNLSSAYEHDYRIEQYEARAGFRDVAGERNTLEYGTGINLYRLHRGTVLPYGEKSLLDKVDLGSERGIETSVFISDSYEAAPWLNFDFGLRYTVYNPTGPSSVLRYQDGLPLELKYVKDTITFDKRKPLRWYHEPDLRLSANIKTDPDGSVKLAFNQAHQNIFMLNTTTSVAPNTQWKLADYHLQPSFSNQVSIGIFRTFPRKALEASAEVYYKSIQNFPDFRDGADFLESPYVEISVLQGRQKAYGAEFYLKRNMRKLEGWLSYTYSRSVIRVTGENSWERINNGETYPSNYDIPHSLNMVLTYHFTRRLILSSIFTWQRGKPITYPESVYYINGVPYLDYSKRNAYHIPDYIRADLSFTIEGNLKAEKLLHSSLVFNLYNATARENPYSVYFNTIGGRIKSYRYSIIGVPVFTATWLFKLGNYASD